MQMRDSEAPERKVSRYAGRPGTLGLTLDQQIKLRGIRLHLL